MPHQTDEIHVADEQRSTAHMLRTVGLVALCVVAVVISIFLLYTAWQIATQNAGPGVTLARGVGPPTARSQFNLDDLRLPRKQILSGGVPKDGIPALTMPRTVPVAEAGFMEKTAQRVVGVTVNGTHRAYPIALLTYHECVNDELGGVPIAIIFCPLCDSVTVVDRRLDEETFEFGISGLLSNSNVLLFDRTDEALWSQVSLEAISGPHAGQSLKHLDGWQILNFNTWKASHPEGTVVSFEPEHRRSYYVTPYAHYFLNDDLMFPANPRDDRFLNKALVIGIRHEGITRAYPLEVLRDAKNGMTEDRIGTGRVTLGYDPATGTVDIVAVPEGAQVVHTFWFAWYAFHPETEVWGQ